MTEQTKTTEQEWLTAKQVAEKYNVRVDRVYNWSIKKRVTTKHIGPDLYFSNASVDAFLQRLNRNEGVNLNITVEPKAPKTSKVQKVAEVNEAPITALPVQVQETNEVERLMDLRRDDALKIGRLEGSLFEAKEENARLHERLQEFQALVLAFAAKQKKKSKAKG